MQAAADGQLKNAAFRELRAIMMRLAKGEPAMRVEIWRTNKKLAWMSQTKAMKARLEAEMKAAIERFHAVETLHKAEAQDWQAEQERRIRDDKDKLALEQQQRRLHAAAVRAMCTWAVRSLSCSCRNSMH